MGFKVWSQVGSKVPYFFFPDKFVFVHFWAKSNEWMKKLFFFPVPGKKKQFWNRMNKWPTNLSAGKKKKENLPEIFWKRQKSTCFFFPRFRKKKKHDFRIWMNEWPTNLAAKKKNKVPLVGYWGQEFQNYQMYVAFQIFRLKALFKHMYMKGSVCFSRKSLRAIHSLFLREFCFGVRGRFTRRGSNGRVYIINLQYTGNIFVIHGSCLR